MQIKISKSSLSEALNNVQAVVGAKASLQILQNVMVEASNGVVKFTCSDLDTTLVATAECEVTEEGSTTVPAKLFTAAVGKLVEGDVTVKVDLSDCSTISSGASVFKFRGLPAKEFPTLPSPDGMSCTIDCNALRELLRKTSFAVSDDATRKTLQGVLLEFKDGNGKVRAVGSDGRRLAMLDCTLDSTNGFSGEFILPRKAVDLLSKKLPKDGNAELITAKNQLLVKTDHLTVTTKLVDDKYPNYMQVVPKDCNTSIKMDRADFLGALDRISVFTSSTECPSVVLTFSDNNLCLNSGDKELGSSHDEIPVKYDGEKLEMHFNPAYIRDVLMAMDEDEVEMKVVNSYSQCIIKKSESTDFTYVVMPLRF